MDMTTIIAPHATPYNNYRYLWSPRPEAKITPASLERYKDDGYIAQPKANGANTLIFTNGEETRVMNRHNQDKAKEVHIDFASLHKGNGWMVLNGEWMEKSKKDENGKNFNGNFLIFDILVFNGQILTGSTLQDRILLLDALYGHADSIVNSKGEFISHSHLYPTAIDKVWRVASYGITLGAYSQVSNIDMFEGLVLKRLNAKLAPPFSQTSNSAWQLKCRKPTKIYRN